MAINGRAKGSENERKVAKILTKWAGYEFSRVPMSGGLRWEEDNNVTGDIVPPFDLKFPLSVECKKVEIDWELDKLLCKTSELWGFWKQACRDASRHIKVGVVKEPWLIFTKNRRKHHVMMRELAWYHLLMINPAMEDLPYMRVSAEPYNVFVVPLEELLNTVSLEEVLSLRPSAN